MYFRRGAGIGVPRKFSRPFTAKLFIKHPFAEWLSHAQRYSLDSDLGSKKYFYKPISVAIAFKCMREKKGP